MTLLRFYQSRYNVEVDPFSYLAELFFIIIPYPTSIVLKRMAGSSSLNTVLRYNFSSQSAEIIPILILSLGTSYFFLPCRAITLYLNTMSKKFHLDAMLSIPNLITSLRYILLYYVAGLKTFYVQCQKISNVNHCKSFPLPKIAEKVLQLYVAEFYPLL